MAINPRRQNVEDAFKGDEFIGITNVFNNPNGIFNKVKTTSENVKNKIINFLLTSPNERIHNYDFIGLYDYLFEQMDEGKQDFLFEDLKIKIENKFPTVKILNLDISSNENTLSLKLVFSVNDNEDNIIINIT
jgi:hypothetical protein